MGIIQLSFMKPMLVGMASATVHAILATHAVDQEKANKSHRANARVVKKAAVLPATVADDNDDDDRIGGEGTVCPTQAAMGSAHDKVNTANRAVTKSKQAAVTVVPTRNQKAPGKTPGERSCGRNKGPKVWSYQAALV